MTQSNYVNSGYRRIEDDFYKTIDYRCTLALLQSWDIPLTAKIVDCCAPSGSGIVDDLIKYGRANSSGVGDAFAKFEADWIITNPPYTRPLVDEIAAECLLKLRSGAVQGVALLVRANWDLAQSRSMFFLPPWYNAQVRMRFRPWWSEERVSAPIHNFVWHIWEKHSGDDPIIKYWPENK